MLEAPGRPISRPRLTSSSCRVVGIDASCKVYIKHKIVKSKNKQIVLKIVLVLTYLDGGLPSFRCLRIERIRVMTTDLLLTPGKACHSLENSVPVHPDIVIISERNIVEELICFRM